MAIGFVRETFSKRSSTVICTRVLFFFYRHFTRFSICSVRNRFRVYRLMPVSIFPKTTFILHDTRVGPVSDGARMGTREPVYGVGPSLRRHSQRIMQGRQFYCYVWRKQILNSNNLYFFFMNICVVYFKKIFLQNDYKNRHRLRLLGWILNWKYFCFYWNFRYLFVRLCDNFSSYKSSAITFSTEIITIKITLYYIICDIWSELNCFKSKSKLKISRVWSIERVKF